MDDIYKQNPGQVRTVLDGQAYNYAGDPVDIPSVATVAPQKSTRPKTDSSIIRSDVLTPQTDLSTQIKYPAPTPAYPVETLDVTPPPAPAVDTSIKATPQETEAQKRVNEILGLNPSLEGETAYRGEQERAQGLPDMLATQNQLASQLKALQNEYKAIPLQIQDESIGRGRTAGGIAPLQADRQRRNAIQSLGVSSLLEASRGNIALAENLVDRAVEQKYGPIKEKIATAKANLDLRLNSPDATVAEKNRATKQKEAQDKKAKEVAKSEDDTKTIQSWAVAALANGASSYQAQQIMKQANVEKPDLKAAFALYAPFAKDPIETEKALLDLENTRAKTAKIKSSLVVVPTGSLGKLTPTQTNSIKQAGLGSAKEDTKKFFINTEPAFQDQIIRTVSAQGLDLKSVSASDLEKLYKEWKKKTKKGGSNIDFDSI